MLNLEFICKKTAELAKEVGAYIAEECKNFSQDKIEEKGLHNYVSYVDKTAEEKIVAGLKPLIPEAAFLTEEETISYSKAEYTWVIDPLDGTTNFIHGLPPFAVSIGLMYLEKPVLGVIFEVNMKECFYAWENGGAWLNGQPIKVSAVAKVNQSLICTGFPVYQYNRMENFMKTLEFFIRNTHGMRRLGSAATDLAYVACGRLDAFYEYNLSPWDVCAGAVIVQEAGGKCADFKQGNNYIFGKEIVASNALIFEEIQQNITSLMNA